MSLENRRILLGICGSIAAYKSALLIRLLVKEKAELKVVMTPSASDFITPLTLATLSKQEVLTQYFESSSGKWHNHIEWADWADNFIIAPASLNSISKMATGICDNLLLAIYYSYRGPLAIAPAMDHEMFEHPATQRNLNQLKEDGALIINPESGELASGIDGKGRMQEPENILSIIKDLK